MEKQTRYNELLGVPNQIRDPDLYQLLGLDRSAFDPARVEERFREKMGALQSIKSPKHKSFIEFLKGELRRGRATLCDARQRREYDLELLAERRAQLVRILDVVLADGVLGPIEEERTLVLAADVGLLPEETRALLDEELAARGARREGATAAPASAPGDTSWLDAIAPAPPGAVRSATPSEVHRAIARRLPPPPPQRRGPPRRVEDSGEGLVPDLVPPELEESGEAVVAELVEASSEDEVVAELFDSGDGVVAELVEPPPEVAPLPQVRAPEPPGVARTPPRTGVLARTEDLRRSPVLPSATTPSSPPALRPATPPLAPRDTDRHATRPSGASPGVRDSGKRATPDGVRDSGKRTTPPEGVRDSGKRTTPEGVRDSGKRTTPEGVRDSGKRTTPEGVRDSGKRTTPPEGASDSGRRPSGWGKAAVDAASGVCSACLGEVRTLDLLSGKAERLDDDRLHCPDCLDRLVAGLICAVCYQRITRTDMKGGQVRVLPTRRVAHGHCAGA